MDLSDTATALNIFSMNTDIGGRRHTACVRANGFEPVTSEAVRIRTAWLHVYFGVCLKTNKKVTTDDKTKTKKGSQKQDETGKRLH